MTEKIEHATRVDGPRQTRADGVEEPGKLPAIRAEGIDIVEDVDRIIGLIDTATKRKRPADADKASRFLELIRESVPNLLNK